MEQEVTHNETQTKTRGLETDMETWQIGETKEQNTEQTDTGTWLERLKEWQNTDMRLGQIWTEIKNYKYKLRGTGK